MYFPHFIGGETEEQIIYIALLMSKTDSKRIWD